jgi:hypothetical protein
MTSRTGLAAGFAAWILFGTLVLTAGSGQDDPAKAKAPPKGKAPDPAAEAVAVAGSKADRPELRLTEHDKSAIFDPTKPAPVTPALKDQPNSGRILGFEFSRDPLGAPKPFTTFEEVMRRSPRPSRK